MSEQPVTVIRRPPLREAKQRLQVAVAIGRFTACSLESVARALISVV
jgi:hypothetical protein